MSELPVVVGGEWSAVDNLVELVLVVVNRNWCARLSRARSSRLPDPSRI